MLVDERPSPTGPIQSPLGPRKIQLGRLFHKAPPTLAPPPNATPISTKAQRTQCARVCYFPPTSTATWNQFRTDVIPMTNAVIPLLRRNNNKTPTITTIIITYLAQLSDLCFTCSIIFVICGDFFCTRGFSHNFVVCGKKDRLDRLTPRLFF
jgi:hypothetical protein